MFSPVTDRIIYGHFQFLIGLVPRIQNVPIVPVVGFALADFILILLAIWDWRSNRRWNVFPVVLVIMLAYHFSVLNFYQYAFWRVFCEWFVGIG